MHPGTRIGPYEVTGAIGTGGMGEVFRARDTRLNRDVAVKVLPKDFASDADRLRRFEQEAKALAALNHPNILTIHDAGIHEGAPYLVSELLEGRTLREEMNSGPLPARKATDYALQVAHGLAAAHGKGIIHRDLKPDNIFVTKDERVKILDFGLAKLRKASPGLRPPSPLGRERDGVRGESDAETLLNTTEPGMALGTPAYMSPEQVRGEPADHRADMFAFGCVLYEMLSGQRPFKRDTIAETMTAILKEEPRELTEVNPTVAPALDRLVRRCLEKQADRRFQSASDLAFALESQTGSTTSVRSKPDASTPPRRFMLKLGLASIILLVLGVAIGSRLAWRAPKASATTYKQLTFRRGTIYHSRFAPGGQSVYYSAKWGQEPLTVFAVQEGRRAETSLGLTNADLLAVSRAGDLAVLTDIRHLGWFANEGTLARLKPGEAPRPLLENITEADWFPDGTNLVVVRVAGGMWRLEEFPSRKVLYQTSGYLTYPRVSPSGELIAFMAHQLRFDNRGWVVILDRAGKTNALSEEWTWGEGLSWTPSGKEVWFSASKSGDQVEMYALALSGSRRRLTSLPVDFLVQDIAADGRLLAHRHPTSVDIIHGRTEDKSERNLSWLGSAVIATALASDGKSYLMQFGGAGSGADYLAYHCKTDGSPPVLLGEGNPMALSPDGNWALVLRYSPSRLILLPTGTGQSRTVDTAGIEPQWANFLSDGKRILYAGHEAGRPVRIFVQEMDEAKPRPVTPEGIELGSQGTLSFTSPTGDRFIGSGTNQVSLLCFVDGSTPRPIANLTAQDLILGWCTDGQSVFVVRRNHWPYTVYKLDVTTGQKSTSSVLQLNLTDGAGVIEAPWILITPDTKSYLYTLRRLYSDEFIVEGLK